MVLTQKRRKNMAPSIHRRLFGLWFGLESAVLPCCVPKGIPHSLTRHASVMRHASCVSGADIDYNNVIPYHMLLGDGDSQLWIITQDHSQ